MAFTQNYLQAPIPEAENLYGKKIDLIVYKLKL